MIGAFILFTAFICFAVSFLFGLFITVLGFRRISSRENAGNPWLLWSFVSAGTLVILIILVGAVADFGDTAQPSMEGYEAMTRTLVLWALAPGMAMCAGGVANLIRASKLQLIEE